MEALSPSGEATVLACARFQGSSCPPGRSSGIPKGMGFSPSLLAFEGNGDLVVWSNGPRELYRMTPAGALTDLGADYIAGLPRPQAGRSCWPNMAPPWAGSRVDLSRTISSTWSKRN